MTMTSPFHRNSAKPLVALAGTRNGYIQLSTARLITQYAELPPELFLAAQAWAARLEALGAKRVYWITLSEVVTHLHIHLYPRWSDDEDRGVSLFEQRDNTPQPAWASDVNTALTDWANTHQVTLIDSPAPTLIGNEARTGLPIEGLC